MRELSEEEWGIAYECCRSAFLPRYEMLEKQFCRTAEYVTLSPRNKKAFSLEYSKLLLTTCAEIDVFAKAFASLVDPVLVSKDANIKKWGIVLQEAIPEISNYAISVRGYGALTPWGNWEYEWYVTKKGANRIQLKGSAKTPFWWTAYNKVKHERATLLGWEDSSYLEANQFNALNALAGLYILESLFVEECNRHDNAVELLHSDLFLRG